MQRLSGKPFGVIALATVIAVAGLALAIPRLSSFPTSVATGVPDRATGSEPDVRAQLEWQVARDPRDGRAWVLLARIAADEERYADAVNAYARALDLPKVARDALVWCEYADAVAMTQQGVLAGRPRQLIEHALTLDPRNPRALEMAGSAEYENGEFASAAARWRMLLPLLSHDASAQQQLQDAIARAERNARVQLPRIGKAQSNGNGGS